MLEAVKKIKMIVCDVDDTLIPTGEKEMPRHVAEALKKAEEKGLVVMINTGRHYGFLQPSLFDDLSMKINGTINGACLCDRNGHTLAKKRIPENEFQMVTDICRKYDIGLAYKFEDNIVCYNNYDFFVSVYIKKERGETNIVIDDTKERSYHLKSDPLGMFLVGAEEYVPIFKEKMPNMEFAWSFRGGYDAFFKEVTKATSIEAALGILNLKWENVIAFGDAGNDIDMLEKAGIAVAMEGGKDHITEIADYIAPPCKEGGVAIVLENLGIVNFRD